MLRVRESEYNNGVIVCVYSEMIGEAVFIKMEHLSVLGTYYCQMGIVLVPSLWPAQPLLQLSGLQVRWAHVLLLPHRPHDIVVTRNP